MFWILAIFAGVCLTLIVFCLPETHARPFLFFSLSLELNQIDLPLFLQPPSSDIKHRS